MHYLTPVAASPLRKWLSALMIASLLFVAAPALTGHVASAQENPAVTIVNTIDQIRLLLVLISTGIATLIFTGGAAMYMMASGSPQQMEAGKTTMRGSVIGLILVFLAVAIVGFVAGALETTTGQSADPTTLIWPMHDGAQAGIASALEWTRG